MSLFLIFLIVTAIVVAYITFGRKLICDRPWFVRWVEPVEIALWRKSETLLWARYKMLLGGTLAFLTQIGQVNLSPLLLFIPDRWQWLANALIALIPLAISLVGWLDEAQRRDTTKPLAVVAVPSNAPQELRAIVKEVEVTNALAVATVAIAKEEGRV